MKLKSETLLNLGLTALLAFSVAYLISSAALLKIKPCAAPTSFKVSKGVKGEWELPYSLEREGFFLSKGAKKAKEKFAKEEVVESIGEYTLKGTVVCSKCGHSIAILKNKEGKSIVVAEGEEINGYRLKKVLPQQVIFKKGKKEFILKLEEKGEKRVKRPVARSFQTERFTVEKKEVVKEISSGEFLKYINIVPTKNPEGLKVNYVNPKSFIYKLGIRPGDVILAINDIRIKTPEDSFSAFERLKSADTITITVLRRGKEVKLHYELQ